MLLPVRQYGDPVLREAAPPVAAVTPELRELAANMVETMRASRGVGLAAQQVGRAVPLCVVEVPPELDTDEAGVRQHPELAMPMVLVNPVITELSRKTAVRDEGCLSFADLQLPISRSLAIVVKYIDLEGAPHVLAARDFLARVIQHEVDHLNGVLFIDRVSAVKRIALKNRLRKMREETLTS